MTAERGSRFVAWAGKYWTIRPPQQDSSHVGITFVDVLFAIAMEKVFEPLAQPTQLNRAGIAQLALAASLTVTSWVGYHSSWNRPQWIIHFPNLPLIQFLIDVVLVTIYWLLAAYYPHDGVSSTIAPVLMTVLTFALYAAWDWSTFLMRRDPRYWGWNPRLDVPNRRWVTAVCLFVSVMFVIVVSQHHLKGSNATTVICYMLIGLVVTYRFAKDFFQAPVRSQSDKDLDELQ